jgi:aryl-alcohol dehydrogenase-like predicted oxidoreductase
MLTRAIPTSGESLPVIGLGTWQVFDVDGTAQELADRKQIVEALFDAGGTVIDTSPMYRRSERIVGEVLAAGGYHDQAFLATKVWTDGETAGRRQMQRSAELMLADRIDLMQVHNRRDMDAHWPTIREFQQDGFIRYSGITDYRDSADEAMMALMRQYNPDFIQINYSLLERGAGLRLFLLSGSVIQSDLVTNASMTSCLFEKYFHACSCCR